MIIKLFKYDLEHLLTLFIYIFIFDCTGSLLHKLSLVAATMGYSLGGALEFLIVLASLVLERWL